MLLPYIQDIFNTMNQSGACSSRTDVAEAMTSVLTALDQLMDEIQTLLGLTNANVNLALLRGIKSVILAHMNGPAGGAVAAD